MEDDGAIPQKIFKMIRTGAPSLIGSIFDFPASDKIRIEDLIKVIANVKQLQVRQPWPEHRALLERCGLWDSLHGGMQGDGVVDDVLSAVERGNELSRAFLCLSEHPALTLRRH